MNAWLGNHRVELVAMLLAKIVTNTKHQIIKKEVNMISLKKELTETLKIWNNFLPPVEVNETHPPKIGELRVLNCFPYLYLLPVQKTEKIFKVLVFTEDVLLGYLGKGTPILGVPSQKLLLVGLPLWIYLLENFLEKYSYPIAVVPETDLESYLQFAETTPIPNTYQGTYIKKIAQILAPFNTLTLLNVKD